MDLDYLNGIGTVLEKNDLPSDLILDEGYKRGIRQFERSLTEDKPRSMLIHGEGGVGKSSMVNALARDLASKGWLIFRATASDVMANQKYIGELEGQIKGICDELMQRKRHLWIIPEFHEFFFIGRYSTNPIGGLDHLMPYLMSGKVKVVGELSTASLEKLLQFRPKVREVLDLFRVDPYDKEDSVGLAKEWCGLPENAKIWGKVDAPFLEEAAALSGHYLTHQEWPGNLFSLLRQTQQVIRLDKPAGRAVKIADLHDTLHRLTGLPINILNDSEKLDLETIRQEFRERVLGQNEAIELLIERVAMIKAGLVDPSRPAGVFLFVGPTGTGKTEIAKNLTRFLFGSEERMIRLDMSEFQTADSLSRIYGEAGVANETTALINRVRKQPFSVILLDEFEKAHANIWDLFLQVFDDGRLTDPQGQKADFRHAIIIMTSNVGAGISNVPAIGFNQSEPDQINQKVQKALEGTFRPEFLNRIDRIVVFRPLSKAVMRHILKIELKKILDRRAFRNRQWAIEYEDAALEFLLEKGFTSNLGARPLKRAIEQYLLAPLALTIVNHNVPQGHQFLFVKRSKGKLVVDFVDPEEPKVSWKDRQKKVDHQKKKGESLPLANIAFDPTGNLAEREAIGKAYSELTNRLKKRNWAKAKEALMARMTEAGFWESDARFEVLSEIEYRDRFEAGLDTCESLLARLEDKGEKVSLQFSPEVLQQLANRLILLRKSLEAFDAGEECDCRIIIQPDRSQPHAEELAGRLYHMYRQWARKRKMTFKEENTPEGSVLEVSGFAAYVILKQEAGIHVWEQPNGQKKALRSNVRITVEPIGLNKVIETPAPTELVLVRKYRRMPTALVKDYLAGWRSGRLDRVLEGTFDLMGEKQ